MAFFIDVEGTMSSYRFCDRKEIDPKQVWGLYRTADWAKNRTFEETETILAQSSLVLSLWEDHRLVAFARVLTDFVVRAVIFDVIVHPKERGKGLGRLLMEKLLTHPSLEKVPVFILQTKDKQAFYTKFGFVQSTEHHVDAMLLIREKAKIPFWSDR
jgi:GNAT superfamily N-acetyltransferase